MRCAAIFATLTGIVVSKLGRYQIVAVAGAAILAGGVFLVVQMNASTSLFDVTRNMIMIGIGLGSSLPNESHLTHELKQLIPEERTYYAKAAALRRHQLSKLAGGTPVTR